MTTESRGDHLSPREVADRLGVTVRTVQRWVADGRLRGHRVGGRLRLAAGDLGAVADTPSSAARPAQTLAIRTLLIANRGEIAARIARTAARLGIRTVGIHPPGERLHGVFDLDRVVPSYLDAAAVIDAARSSGADAIHPGYGFLSESAAFAEAVEASGLAWVGPPASAIAAAGDKAAARRAASERGIPVVSGYDGEDQADETLTREAGRIGWPLLVKPAGGGGGKGMHVVPEPGQLAAALAAARREAMGAFGDDRLILERLLKGPRHVEVQLLFDAHGSAIHVGARDCSAQRRHQKIVEEAPPPSVDAALTERLGAAAIAVAAAIGYRNAGTVEFLVADAGSFYFLEMNTRLQVEHPVTELVSGRDLVADQIRIAAGEPLGVRQAEIRSRGHAIEARLYAEDPEAGFLPATGRIAALRWPAGDGVRLDAGVDVGDEVSDRYDPLLAKLIVHARDRPTAVRRLAQALNESSVLGVRTNVSFLRWLVAQAFFRDGETRTDTIARSPLPRAAAAPETAWTAAARLLVARASDPGRVWSGAWRLNSRPAVRLRCGDEERRVVVEAQVESGDPRAVFDAGTAFVDVDGQSVEFRLAAPPTVEETARHAAQSSSGAAALTAPMPGRVIAINHTVGEAVAAHDAVVVLEAMKMENAVVAPFAGTLTALHVRQGQQVQRGDLIAEVSP
ncbi:MAG: biotin carboxylase N-terminal domain-containing protein [Candidatus Limnocylindria bacterium]